MMANSHAVKISDADKKGAHGRDCRRCPAALRELRNGAWTQRKCARRDISLFAILPEDCER
jgi:hypothetical protein